MHWGNYQSASPMTRDMFDTAGRRLPQSGRAASIGGVPPRKEKMPLRSVSHRRISSRSATPRWPRLASVRPRLIAGALPRELSGFVGRQDETAAIIEQLRDNAGVVTLTGIGGVGKTRLATHVAAQLQAAYADGARFVTLAHLPEKADVATALLAGLGVRDWPDVSPEDTLVMALRKAQMLLVLDNCEHLVQACAEVVEQLLRQCPGDAHPGYEPRAARSDWRTGGARPAARVTCR